MQFLVSDIRQYTYCPRIVYYHYCLPDIRPTTYKMAAGKLAHGEEQERERRRSLRPYHLADGERTFDVWLDDEAVGLRGKVDMVVRRAEEIIPIEHKNSPGRMGQHVILQLMAYGLLLERQWQLPFRRGFVYHIPARRAREVETTEALLAAVHTCVAAMQAMVEAEQMPAPPEKRQKCAICEFRRFCNDVV
jgi:CRISPR-associated exonuclease Cas4